MKEFVEAFGSLLPVNVPLAPLVNFSKDLGGCLGSTPEIACLVIRLSRPPSHRRRATHPRPRRLQNKGNPPGHRRLHPDFEIPSDFLSLAAALTLTFQREPVAATVHAEVDIQGEMHDWEKAIAASRHYSTASPPAIPWSSNEVRIRA